MDGDAANVDVRHTAKVSRFQKEALHPLLRAGKARDGYDDRAQGLRSHGEEEAGVKTMMRAGGPVLTMLVALGAAVLIAALSL